MLTEINFDGIIGPSHNYAGLSRGNIASARHAGDVSQPRAAALQGIDKMRHNLAIGLPQGFFVPLDRPDARWLAALGTTPADAEGHLRAQAWSASSMWAANAATVSLVAAFVAGALDAVRLDLVKPAEVGASGLDGCFAMVVPAGLEVRVVGWERFVQEVSSR